MSLSSRARRALLVSSLALAVGCRRREPTGLDATRTQEQFALGVRFVVLYLHGADESSPLLVAMHGRGASPEQFADLWRDFPDRVEIALPQAFDRFRDGWSWFDWPPGLGDDALAANIDAAERKLWEAIGEVSHGRTTFVTGFSQGGVLSYVLAARHGDALAGAFPVSGGAPMRLLSHDSPAAPVYALHGTAD